MEEDEEEDSTIDDEEDARIRQGLPLHARGAPYDVNHLPAD